MSIMNFFRGNDGGFMDVIRCDAEEYLVEKWTPNGEVNATAKENAIRYGSRLLLKPNESAVFFYSDGTKNIDVIEGPINDL